MKKRTVICPADGKTHQVDEASARRNERKFNTKITRVYHSEREARRHLGGK